MPMSLNENLSQRTYSTKNPPSLADFKTLCSQRLQREKYPLCAEICYNVPIYTTGKYDVRSDTTVAQRLADEFYDILRYGSGVLVLKDMFPNKGVIGQATKVFSSIIQSEKSNAKGDHFGESGANDRIWNSFEKHGLMDPVSFFEYYSNPWLSLVCEAWLGPGFRMTAQVNVVKPGGSPQRAHRDYHLGFLDAETCAKFPRAMQIASQHLTLQGAIAHCDCPTESGPTRLLPFSQMFEEGYMAYRLPEFAEYFAQNHVNLPLEIGDGLFFNPALFHAAGENRTSSVNRIANLLQVSSAFGKPMESVQNLPLVANTWSLLTARYAKQGMSADVRAFIAIVAEGYPFPTNLDKRPPRPNGMAPETEQELLIRALLGNWNLADVTAQLRDMRV